MKVGREMRKKDEVWSKSKGEGGEEEDKKKKRKTRAQIKREGISTRNT